MKSSNEVPFWGQPSYDHDARWFDNLKDDAWDYDQAGVRELQEKALQIPDFDFFAEFMPTGKPKHDIGRYVQSHGIAVPLIDSHTEWQTNLLNGTAMLRSEHWQDYAGYSGLLDSWVVPLKKTYPIREDGSHDGHREWDLSQRNLVTKRTVEGPIKHEIDLYRLDSIRGMGTTAMQDTLRAMLADGLYDGSTNPAWLTRTMMWQNNMDRITDEAFYYRAPQPEISIDQAQVSRWRYVAGVNIRIFRDPVIEGKYFIGGREAHHHWEITDGRDSENLVALTKAGYRGRGTKEETFEYELPTQQIVDLYEQVRTLPFFDQEQAPSMEFQYGDDGELYFLQYFKTAQIIEDPREFSLPHSHSAVTAHDVRGATDVSGEELRIYLDPRVFTKFMEGQGFYIDFNMSRTHGNTEQTAAMMSRVAILDYMLCFKDNHFSSAPLLRAPVAIGLYDEVGEAAKRFHEVMKQVPFRDVWTPKTEVEYIEARVTSNGRNATIESDWVARTERVN